MPKHTGKIVFLICLAGSLANCATAAKKSETSSYLKKVKTMPDFCQRDKRFGKLPADGRSYCGPTAISNALLWLANNGHPNLVDRTTAPMQTQFDLIKLLGSARFMKTDKDKGTSPQRIMKGLDKYVNDRGYQAKIEWKSWRKGGKYSTGKIPSRGFLAGAVRGRSNLVLNVGWYTHDNQTDTYTRIGGHYVTMVGYQKLPESKLSIIIHDPSPRSGLDTKHETCQLVPILKGTLAKWQKYEKRSAKGYLIMEGIKVKKGAQLGIIDGAIKFSVKRKLPTPARR